MVVHALQTVMEVGELGLGARDGVGGRIGENVVVVEVVVGAGAIFLIILGFAAVARLGLGLVLLSVVLPLLGRWRGLRLRVEVLRHDHQLEELEGIRVVGRRGGNTKLVPGGDVDLVALETEMVVDLDLEGLGGLAQLDLRGTAQVAVGIEAVAEGEAVDAVVRPEVGGAVVEEAPDHAGGPAVLVDDEGQAVETADGVYARGAYLLAAPPREPDVEVPAAPLAAAHAEVDVSDPFAVLVRLVGPGGAARVAGDGRREYDLVGEDLGEVRRALDREAGHTGLSAIVYPTRGDGVRGQRETGLRDVR